MEAMPPRPSNLPLPLPMRPQVPLDPSIRHPVFFTDRLKKAPNGVAPGGGSWVTPVAAGYVFNDGVRRNVEAARL